MKKIVFDLLQSDDTLKKRLAKVMALRCFRNTVLEDFHAGKVPRSDTGDYADVKVVTPSQEIPWRELSRISDPEMRHLMKNVVNQCYTFLLRLLSSPEGDRIMQELMEGDELAIWAEPVDLRKAFEDYDPR